MNPAITSGQSSQQAAATGESAKSTGIVIPFTRASHERRQSCGIDITRTMLASDQDLGTISIPAYGYLRALWLLVTMPTAAVVTDGVVAEDAPFNIIKNIFLSQPNGAVIHQSLSGYDLMLANKFGGYTRNNDPRAGITVNTLGSTGGSTQFALRIPIV